MHVLQDLRRQLEQWFQRSSHRQKLVTAGAGLAVLAGLAAAALHRPDIEYVSLSVGNHLDDQQLAEVESSLRQQQFNDFRTADGRILVPADRVDAYRAALPADTAPAGHWAAEWERRLEESNPFTSSTKLHMLKDNALAKELRRILVELDGIQDASVVWAEDSQRGSAFGPRQRRVTATVNVRPEEGRPLAERTIRAIQFSVANMVAGLEPQDVIVFDLTQGRHYQLNAAQARFEVELDAWKQRQLDDWQTAVSEFLRQQAPEATALVRIDDSALRRAANSGGQTAIPTHSPSDAGPVSAANAALSLSSRTETPEYLTVRDIPVTGHREFADVRPYLDRVLPALLRIDIEAAAPAADEARRRLLDWLPTDVPESAVTAVAVAPADSLAADTDADRAIDLTSVSPLLAGGLLSLLLFGLARSLSGRKSAGRARPHVAAAVSVDTTAPQPPARTTESPRAAPASPLGDPETIARALESWLAVSDGPDESREEPGRG